MKKIVYNDSHFWANKWSILFTFLRIYLSFLHVNSYSGMVKCNLVPKSNLHIIKKKIQPLFKSDVWFNRHDIFKLKSNVRLESLSQGRNTSQYSSYFSSLYNLLFECRNADPRRNPSTHNAPLLRCLCCDVSGSFIWNTRSEWGLLCFSAII